MRYLFKNSNEEVEIINEKLADRKLRNRSQWERQDVYYLGAISDEKVQECDTKIYDRKIEVRTKVFEGTDVAKKLSKEKELAELQKDQDQVRIKTLEYEIAFDTFENVINDRSGNTQNEKHDFWRKQVLDGYNVLIKEETSKLEGDKSIMPRSFETLYDGKVDGHENTLANDNYKSKLLQ